jgi:hypothetical protein
VFSLVRSTTSATATRSSSTVHPNFRVFGPSENRRVLGTAAVILRSSSLFFLDLHRFRAPMI